MDPTGFSPPQNPSHSSPNSDHVPSRIPNAGSMSGQSPASQQTPESSGSNPIPTAPVPTSTSRPSNGVSNPRSCVTCRRRKVKCDKKHPCSNCQRAHIECVFPAPGRAPRKARRPPDAELLERLRKLEGVVKGLGMQVHEEVSSKEKGKDKTRDERSRPSVSGSTLERTGTAGTTTTMDTADPDNSPSPDDTEMDANTAIDGVLAHGDPYPCGANIDQMPRGSELMSETKLPNQPAGLESKFGRLVVGDGRSRYISNTHWANLQDEVENLKGMLQDDSDDELYDESPTDDNHQSFIFGFSSTEVDMVPLHPDPELFPVYWSLYKENIDPLIKMLHIPTIEPKLFEAKNDLTNIPRGMEALMFAVYYSVTTSLMPADCSSLLQEEKQLLNKRYRFGLEQALARANFMISNEMIVLQALVIFLVCLRRNEEARTIWTFTGLLVRIAQSLGIHRDGTHFGLPPFEIDMRRRLWWQICILDARASEDHGCDPTITESMYDTQLPINVNDSELTPAMTELPTSRQGCTEATFCLIRYEIISILKRIQFVPAQPPPCVQRVESITLEEKERWIRECQERMESRYLSNCDMTVPLYWVTATVSRLIISKMWLLIYHPFQRLDGGKSLPQETRDRLFITSLENIEYSILLETETRTMKWGWLFRTYVQWYATAFILSELCERTEGPLVDRAWRAVRAQFMLKTKDDNADPKGHKRQTGLWRPLRKLYLTACKARAASLGQVQDELAMQQSALPAVQPNALAHLSANARGRMTYPPGPSQQQPSTTPSSSNTEDDGIDAMLNNLMPFRSNLFLPGGNLLPNQSQSTYQSGSVPSQGPANPSAAQPSQESSKPANFDLEWLVLDTAMNQPPMADPQLAAMSVDKTNNPNGIPNLGSPDLGDIAMGEGQRSASVGGSSSDEELNWANFDDMVKEYGMEMDPRFGDDGGQPRPGGFGLQNWF